MSLPLVTTEDGSLSCFDEETGELFHNRAGAFTEAQLNYFEPSQALETLKTTGKLSVLDACFGLGYNSWVLLSNLLTEAPADSTVSITAIETDARVLSCAVRVLEFDQLLAVRDLFDFSDDLAFGIRKASSCRLKVSLHIQHSDLRKLLPNIEQSFDLVFHDPFSPKRMPELWTIDLFKHYYRLLKPGAGRLLTYSAAAAVRGALMQSGFKVYRTTALGGKSGGTLGSVCETVTSECVLQLAADEIDKIKSESGIPYRDPSLNATRPEILKARHLEQEHVKRLRADNVKTPITIEHSNDNGSEFNR